MHCIEASEAAIPEGGYSWSLKVCQRGVFRAWRDESGNSRPISDTRIRSGGLNSGEPCQFHLGHVAQYDNGNSTMWYCGRPVTGGEAATFLSPMKIARKSDGSTCGVGWHKSPLWTLLRYFSVDRYCGLAQW